MPKHIRTIISEFDENLDWYFEHLHELNENFPEEIALAYLFSKVEEAQNMTIYMAMRKLHRVDSTLARSAVDRHQMTRSGFRKFYKDIVDRNMPAPMLKKIQSAESVRDRILHGKQGVTRAEVRQAIRDVLDYAKKFNDELYPILGVNPFGMRTGFTGPGSPLDKKTSRWVIKGMGL